MKELVTAQAISAEFPFVKVDWFSLGLGLGSGLSLEKYRDAFAAYLEFYGVRAQDARTIAECPEFDFIKISDFRKGYEVLDHWAYGELISQLVDMYFPSGVDEDDWDDYLDYAEAELYRQLVVVRGEVDGTHVVRRERAY
jgi:hypothetical protein